MAGGASEAEAVEQIDIGGPAMLRAAAKNFGSVIVVPSPEFYDDVLAALDLGEVPAETRRRLAHSAFRLTAHYDAAIVDWFENGERFPDVLEMRYEKVLPLRYGENPHQGAAYYARAGGRTCSRAYRSCRARNSPSTT